MTTLNTANTPNVICHCCAAGAKLNIKISFLACQTVISKAIYTHCTGTPLPLKCLTWPLTLKIKCLILLLAGDENLYFHWFATTTTETRQPQTRQKSTILHKFTILKFKIFLFDGDITSTVISYARGKDLQYYNIKFVYRQCTCY